MSLQTRIINDLQDAIRNCGKRLAAGSADAFKTKDAVKVIIGEMQRAEKKTLSDDEVVKVLRKLEKSELEMLEKIGETESHFLITVRGYMPQMASDEEITQWIRDNIDWGQFKNKMQAVGVVMKHFGVSADGNRVREIIQKF